MIPWHRLLGLSMTDLFSNTCFQVEMETDLSLKRQLLDVLLIKNRPGPLPEVRPDGLEGLTTYNLISYKSLHESVSPWMLDELLSHYVSYRKLLTPRDSPLVPEEEFMAYALCTRYPRDLARGRQLVKRGAGLYDILWGSQTIRIIVLSEIPMTPQNALWNLFSGIPANVAYGRLHFEGTGPETSTVINRLYHHYELEGINMPYTIEDFRKEVRQEVLADMTVEERLEGISPQERLAGLSPEQRRQLIRLARDGTD